MKEYRLGIEATLEIIGGKWKAIIICLLMSGVKRTGELERSMPGISQKVLIQQLRELERDGLVTRQVYQQMPPKVEYSLTEYGITANTIVDVMRNPGFADQAEWSDPPSDLTITYDDLPDCPRKASAM